MSEPMTDERLKEIRKCLSNDAFYEFLGCHHYKIAIDLLREIRHLAARHAQGQARRIERLEEALQVASFDLKGMTEEAFSSEMAFEYKQGVLRKIDDTLKPSSAQEGQDG